VKLLDDLEETVVATVTQPMREEEPEPVEGEEGEAAAEGEEAAAEGETAAEGDAATGGDGRARHRRLSGSPAGPRALRPAITCVMRVLVSPDEPRIERDTASLA